MSADVIRFPDTLVARLRLQLRRRRNERMLNRWERGYHKAKPKLSYEEKIHLAALGGLQKVKVLGLAPY
jgi:hypothetical protein